MTNKPGSLVLFAAVAAALAGPAIHAQEQHAMVVVRDSASGQLRAATDAEFKELSRQAAQHPATTPSTAAHATPVGPAIVRQGDGTLRARVGNAALTYSVLTRDADGKTVTQCVSSQGVTGALAKSGHASEHSEEAHHDDQ